MGDGYDYDYLAPRGTTARFLVRAAQFWPDWIIEYEGNTILDRVSFDGTLPVGTESGFVLYRDRLMRERFHRDGGYVDDDGSSPISYWIFGWDDILEHVDLVVDLLPPAGFLAQIQDLFAFSIAENLVCETKSGGGLGFEFTVQDPNFHGWLTKNWSEIVKLEPQQYQRMCVDTKLTTFLRITHDGQQSSRAGIMATNIFGNTTVRVVTEPHDTEWVSFLRRSLLRLVGQWYRIEFQGGDPQPVPFTHPPGDIVVHEGVLAIRTGGRNMAWKPTARAAFFEK